MSLTFKELNLAAPLLEAVEALGFTATTPVQEQDFPAAMDGGDLMVSSQTGSGKNAAFLLQLLQKLIEANPITNPYLAVRNHLTWFFAQPENSLNKVQQMQLI